MESIVTQVTTSGTITQVTCIILTYQTNHNELSSCFGMEEEDFDNEKIESSYDAFVDAAKKKCSKMAKIELSWQEITEANEGVCVDEITPFHLMKVIEAKVLDCNNKKLPIYSEFKECQQL